MAQKKAGLPENAYTPLKEGEKYLPVIPASSSIAEITNRSVIAGLIMAVLFSFAAAYLGMKVGQVFEAAIPIAILAIGMSVLYKRKNTLLENVIIQSIGAASGAIVAGGIFVIPALYILDLNPSLLNTFVVTALGGMLGILFLIPLRKYFVADEHGNLPFPEATATTEILVTGESGGTQANVLVGSMLVGGLYDFMVEVIHLWDKHLSSAKLLMGLGERLADKAKMVFKLDALAALLGLGYIIGIKYSAIIVGGSVLSYLVMIPAFYFLGQHVPDIIYPGKQLISTMDEVMIFDTYVRPIGIGAIACAGIIGILKNGKIIVSSFGVGFREMAKSGGSSTVEKPERTNIDLSMKTIVIGSLIITVLLLVFFLTMTSVTISLVSLILILILCFLFTMVAARAIAIVGVNPVSGMTLVTLIISSVILVNIGLSGTQGMIIALLVGAVVCTSLSMSGAFITDLKIGYWLGSTPVNQEKYKFLGVIVSAISVSLAILLINEAFGFVLPSGVVNPDVPAPQGNLMAAIISSLMANEPVPWLLYGLGVIIAIMLEMVGVPPLAFALGMYLPIQLNVPLLVGGFIAWMVGRSSNNEKLARARKERGTLIASGFIAGGALMGVLGAVLHLDQIGSPVRFISVGINYVREGAIWASGDKAAWFVDYGQWISLVAFIGLCLYVYFEAKRASVDE
ncbi:MAG: oligopeptide transporter, OPT family [candidate division KSB1 bacterium]|jgi:putative OPT family oligopeptide transporter|nr:oligopeptide transporter, OPT family [candidate division KSB1 bacterium]